MKNENLVIENLSLVTAIANKYKGKGVDFDDLVGEGNLALCKAAENFDTNYGVKFSTYAYNCISGAMCNALATNRTIKTPSAKLDMARKIYNAVAEMTADDGKQPTIDEVAIKLQLPLYQVEIVLKDTTNSVLSLDETIGDDDDDFSLANIATNEEDNADYGYDKKEKSALISQALKSLNEIEKKCIVAYYLNDEPKTLREIAKEIGLSHEKTAQILKKAIVKLKNNDFMINANSI